jgi:hypothetical protein
MGQVYRARDTKLNRDVALWEGGGSARGFENAASVPPDPG